MLLLPTVVNSYLGSSFIRVHIKDQAQVLRHLVSPILEHIDAAKPDSPVEKVSCLFLHPITHLELFLGLFLLIHICVLNFLPSFRSFSCSSWILYVMLYAHSPSYFPMDSTNTFYVTGLHHLVISSLVLCHKLLTNSIGQGAIGVHPWVRVELLHGHWASRVLKASPQIG